MHSNKFIQTVILQTSRISLLFPMWIVINIYFQTNKPTNGCIAYSLPIIARKKIPDEI